MEKIIIGSRASKLAVIQAHSVGDQLKNLHPDLDVSYKEITTTGDKNVETPLSSLGGKGVWVKEIEEALLKNEIDLAVHSLKDMPQTLPAGLILGPTPQREDPRDAVISRFGEQLQELPRGSTIGTSSPRRAAQILYRFKKKQYRIEPLRGNVDTRVKKLQDGQYDAIVIALAGLKRLGLEKEATQILENEMMMPAPGQGCLGLELRIDDETTAPLLEALRHEESDLKARAERSFLEALGGNCLLPLGSTIELSQDQMTMKAILLSPDGQKVVEAQEIGERNVPELLGAKLAGRILYEGGSQLMVELEKLHGA